jgi:ribose 5-phosphate isomerase A
MLNEQELMKKQVGERAVDFVEDGMILGLGSGSTAYWMMKKLGERVTKGLSVMGIPTSTRTEGWAKEFGVPLTDFTQVDKIDLAIDGANEIDENLNLTKGGGGSLVREKIVNSLAEKVIIIADKSKMSTTLGHYPLPIEVVPFGMEITANTIAKLGCTPVLRKKNGETYISDNGNYILDCHFKSIPNAQKLHEKLKLIVGVVETGLFLNMTDVVILGSDLGLEIIEAK